MFNRAQCPECNLWTEKDRERCPNCLADMNPPPKATYANARLAHLHIQRIVRYDNHWFVAKKALDLYEDYYGASVGDIIVVQGHGGQSMFFELAAFIEGWGDEPEPAFLILRIDPDNCWPEDWPVLDVEPEDAWTPRDGEET